MSDIYKAPEAQLSDPATPGQYGSMENALSGNYELKPVEIIKQAWEKLPGLKLPFWIGLIVYSVISYAFTFLQITFAGDPAVGFNNVNWPVYTLIGLAQVFVIMPMAVGLFMIALKHSVGRPVEFNEIFKHFDKILNLFLCAIIMYVLVAIGFVLLVIPGIYLAIAFSMAFPLVVEKNMGPWEALMASRKAVTHKWFNMFGFFLLTVLVVLAGFLALIVGIIWAYPVAILGFAIIYRDMFGVEEKTLASA